nr:hypothetical protein [Deltaproteobacteria bacterium]
KTVLTECARVLRDDGVCAVTIGDVRNKEHGSRTLALEAWDSMKDEVPLVLGAAVADDVNQLGKVSKIWGLAHRGEATKVDRVMLFHKPGRSLPRPRWSDPAALIEAIAASPNAPLVRSGKARPGVVKTRATAAARKKTGT